MSYLTLFITVPLTLIAVMFAMSNTADVNVFFTPFDDAMDMPLYMIVLGALGVGFLSGVLFVGLLSYKMRVEKWREKRRADSLEKELKKQSDELTDLRHEKELRKSQPITAMEAVSMSQKPVEYLTSSAK